MSPVPDEDHDKNDSDYTENIESPNLVIADVIDDSDDIEDDDGGHGYELLPQGPEDVNGNDSDSDDDSDSNSGLSEGEVDGQVNNVAQATGLVPGGLYPNFPQGDLPAYLQVPHLSRSDKKEMLWNQPRMSSDENMDSGKISAIKTAMQNFKLPVSNIPDWAANISDENWKEQFVSRMTSCGSDAIQSSVSSVSATGRHTSPSRTNCHSVKEAD